MKNILLSIMLVSVSSWAGDSVSEKKFDLTKVPQLTQEDLKSSYQKCNQLSNEIAQLEHETKKADHYAIQKSQWDGFMSSVGLSVGGGAMISAGVLIGTAAGPMTPGAMLGVAIAFPGVSVVVPSSTLLPFSYSMLDDSEYEGRPHMRPLEITNLMREIKAEQDNWQGDLAAYESNEYIRHFLSIIPREMPRQAALHNFIDRIKQGKICDSENIRTIRGEFEKMNSDQKDRFLEAFQKQQEERNKRFLLD